MAKVGLEKIHIAKVTENTNSSYKTETPVPVPGAIEVNLEPTVQEAKLYADNGLYASETSISDIKVTMGIADLPTEIVNLLLGSEKAADGTVTTKVSDRAPEVALGFASNTSDGGEELVWLFSGKFKQPSENNKTKGESLEYTTPSIEGTFGQRKKDGALKTTVRTKEEGIGVDVVANWFKAVHEAGGSE